MLEKEEEADDKEEERNVDEETLIEEDESIPETMRKYVLSRKASAETPRSNLKSTAEGDEVDNNEDVETRRELFDLPKDLSSSMKQLQK